MGSGRRSVVTLNPPRRGARIATVVTTIAAATLLLLGFAGPAVSAGPSASPGAVASAAAPSPAPGYPTPVPCDDAGFVRLQATHPSGYTEVTVCGPVTQVLPEKTTTSGLHKYFYVQVAAGDTIEIVCNIDVMGEFAVKAGDQAAVHGRFYYDNAASQGIDWTHHNTPADTSWPYPGYVQLNAGPLDS